MIGSFTPRELKGKRLIGYCLGDLGILLSNMLEAVFAFQYYVYTINLNSVLVSIGVTSQLIIGSFFAVIFGVIVDNKKPGKHGKRRPFLLYALPIWFIGSILIWFPPWKCPENNSLFLPTALFFWIVTIMTSISRSLLYSVYLSMLPEQSQTTENREKVASIRSAFAIIASIFALLIPLIVQSLLEDPTNVKWWESSGKVLLFYIPLTATILAIFGLVSVILIYFSVDERFHNRENYQLEKTKILEAYKKMRIPLGDKNYIRFILAGFFIAITGKTLGLLVFPFQTFLLELKASEFYIYIFISIFGKFGWYFLWKRVTKKKNLLVKSYFRVILVAMVTSMLDIFFLIGNLQFGVKILLYIIVWSTVLGSYYSYTLFSIPLGASIVQEAAESINVSGTNLDKNISSISGSYYGLLYFVTYLGPAFASIFVGTFLSGSNEDNPVVITLLFFSMSIFYLISLFFIKGIKIKER
ncbi:MAG: MFS transporter [Candidatus Lokiarchaeota archaeon]|nr:MFS transporter [Candidatus Lokiarchaeota archaeon]